jgi:hypothetical protein
MVGKFAPLFVDSMTSIWESENVGDAIRFSSGVVVLVHHRALQHPVSDSSCSTNSHWKAAKLFQTLLHYPNTSPFQGGSGKPFQTSAEKLPKSRDRAENHGWEIVRLYPPPEFSTVDTNRKSRCVIQRNVLCPVYCSGTFPAQDTQRRVKSWLTVTFI